MADYKNIFNKKAKKSQDSEPEVNELEASSTEELLEIVNPKEKESDVIKTEAIEKVRTAVDIYYDTEVKKYMRVDVVYEESSNKILSLTKTKLTSNLAIELTKVHDYFTNKIFKRK